MDGGGAADANELLAESAWVRRLARALVRDPELAEDVAQETMVAALEERPAEGREWRSWLAAVLRKRVLRARRADARRVAREALVARPEAVESSDALVARAESHRRVVAMVLGLDEPYRATLLQRYLEERPPSEIARRDGVPLATVKTRLQRGLARLREQAGEGERRPAWLVALAGAPRGAELGVGVAAGGALVTMKTAWIAITGLVLVCLLGWGVFALRRPDGLVPQARGEALAPLPGTERNAELANAESVSGSLGVERSTSAPQAAPQEARPTAGAERLTGVVVDTEDRPIAGAWIRAFFNPNATYFTHHGEARVPVCECESDAAGAFELSLSPARAHELEVRAAGFAPMLFTERTAGMRLRVVLERGAALRGTVVDGDSGDPVPGGAVRVFHGAWMVEVPVGAGGRFELDELVPGEVGLLALPERHAVPRYVAETVEPGGVLDATLEVVEGLLVQGRVTDARDGAPIAGAEIVSGRGAWKSARSGGDGRYRLEGVEAVRRETLFVRAPGFAAAQLSLDPATAEAFDIELVPGRAIEGCVVDQGGLAITAGQLVAWTSPFFEGGGAREELSSALDAQGCFRVDGLDPSLAFRLVVRAPGFGTSYFPLAPGGDVDLGELRIGREASIAGVVLAPDGSGVAALLELWPAADEPGGGDPIGMRSMRTDAHGAFAIGDLGAGRYVLRAVAEGFPPLDDHQLELDSGEALRKVRVQIPGGLSIRGLVRDAEGKPVPGVHIDAALSNPNGRPAHARTRTDARGWFELAELPAGTYRLKCTYTGEWTLDGEPVLLDSLLVEDVESGGVPLELVLPALDGRVSGTVLDADGAPVPQAYVFRPRPGQLPGGGVLTDADGRFELEVPSGAPLELIARRTGHLSASEGSMTVSESRMGRSLAPAELGEARLAGVQAGQTELQLRLRP